MNNILALPIWILRNKCKARSRILSKLGIVVYISGLVISTAQQFGDTVIPVIDTLGCVCMARYAMSL